jgi:hypothetical protein
MPCNRQIAVLSDDECIAEDGNVGSNLRGECRPQLKRSNSKSNGLAPSAVRARLGKLSNALCGCARQARRSSAKSCFKQFGSEGMESVFQLVLKLQKLSKHDADCQADVAKLNVIAILTFYFDIDPES